MGRLLLRPTRHRMRWRRAERSATAGRSKTLLAVSRVGRWKRAITHRGVEYESRPPLGRPMTRLFNLEPLSVRTWRRESLWSYICRLAECHRLAVRDLITRVIW